MRCAPQYRTALSRCLPRVSAAEAVAAEAQVHLLQSRHPAQRRAEGRQEQSGAWSGGDESPRIAFMYHDFRISDVIYGTYGYA